MDEVDTARFESPSEELYNAALIICPRQIEVLKKRAIDHTVDGKELITFFADFSRTFHRHFSIFNILRIIRLKNLVNGQSLNFSGEEQTKCFTKRSLQRKLMNGFG